MAPGKTTTEFARPIITPRVFVSHSSKDERIASALVEFLEAAIVLEPPHIRCTSVPGYKLTAGAHTSTQLREEIRKAEVVIGIVTPSSIASSYVLFELGASWGLDKPTFPLLARGADVDSLPGPLKEQHAVSLSERTDIYQVLDDLTKSTSIERRPFFGAKLESKVEALWVAAKHRAKDKTQPLEAPPSAAATEPSVTLEGPPRAPLGRTTYYTVLSQNAVRGEWSVGGFANNELFLINPLGPSYQLKVEPTDPKRVGHDFVIVFTAYSLGGKSARATKRFLVVSAEEG